MELSEFFRLHPRAAIAFSGGTDSSFLLYCAKKYGASVRAYCVRSAFQPAFELEDAQKLAASLGADVRILTADVLSHPEITSNPEDRCYHCKRIIFSGIIKAAAADGFPVLLDGTNASDDASDRPGMAAARELGVLSPLRDCGLTKEKIRLLSKEAGLFTWNKPSYACLATRIPSGEEITGEKLSAAEAAEGYLFSLGFSDFRVRISGGTAKLQLREEQFPLLVENRTGILDTLKSYFTDVLLDLEVRK
ncbi:MAG: ATP-dependent sacrificial sulfur transferase LarE [Oscillospiraceae bacterium]|nr:ATP-dependent sacrificial sulfur transferase LarE [Oscillospiraceae bacterium]